LFAQPRISFATPRRPDDEQLMVAFHRTLSDRSVHLRHFTPLKLDQRIAHERLSRICFIDHDREMALAVEHGDGRSVQRQILAAGRLSKVHGANEAEFALIVREGWRRPGLGGQLLRSLIQMGRDEKLERIVAIILSDNRERQHIARKLGFRVEREPATHEYRAELKL